MNPAMIVAQQAPISKPNVSVGGLRGMKSSHWEGGHRMPFIVRANEPQ